MSPFYELSGKEAGVNTRVLSLPGIHWGNSCPLGKTLLSAGGLMSLSVLLRQRLG